MSQKFDWLFAGLMVVSFNDLKETSRSLPNSRDGVKFPF